MNPTSLFFASSSLSEESRISISVFFWFSFQAAIIFLTGSFTALFSPLVPMLLLLLKLLDLLSAIIMRLLLLVFVNFLSVFVVVVLSSSAYLRREFMNSSICCVLSFSLTACLSRIWDWRVLSQLSPRSSSLGSWQILVLLRLLFIRLVLLGIFYLSLSFIISVFKIFKIKITVHTLFVLTIMYRPGINYSIPPGNEDFPATGTLTLTLSLPVLIRPSSFPPGSLAYKVKMWGDSKICDFIPIEQDRHILSFNIRTSKPLLTKYLMDMETINILLTDNRNKKTVGVVYVSLRRFATVDNNKQPSIMNFDEKFALVSVAKKQKLGEVQVKMELSDIVVPKVYIPATQNQQQHFQQMNQLREPTATFEGKYPEQVVSNSRPDQNPTPQNIPNIDRRQQQIYTNQLNRNRAQDFKRVSLEQNQRNINQKREPFQKKRILQELTIPTQDFAPRATAQLNLAYNLDLELLKLKDDAVTLLQNPQPITQDFSGHEITVEFDTLTFFSKLKAAASDSIALTVIYPQSNNQNPSIKTTTILQPIDRPNSSSGSVFKFGQSITFRRTYEADSEEKNGFIQIRVSGVAAQFPIAKIQAPLTTIPFRNRDTNQRCAELVCKVQERTVKKDYSVLIFLADHEFKGDVFKGKEGSNDYYLRVVSKNYEGLNEIRPRTENQFMTKIIYPVDTNSQTVVLQLWKNTLIKGFAKVILRSGVFQDQVTIRNVRGDVFGYIKVIGVIAETKHINILAEKLADKLMKTEQIRKPRRFKQAPTNNQQRMEQQRTIIDQNQQRAPLPKPEIPSKSTTQNIKPEQTTVAVGHRELAQIYIKILEKLRLCKSGILKTTVDSLLLNKYCSQAELRQFLFKWTGLEARTIQSFQSSLKFPFLFERFANSYLKYCHYQREIRVKVEQLFRKLRKTIPKTRKNLFRNSGVYFGCINSQEFQRVMLNEKVPKKIIEELVQVMISGQEGDIRIEDFEFYWKAGEQIEQLVPNVRILALTVQEKLSSSYSQKQLSQIIQQSDEDVTHVTDLEKLLLKVSKYYPHNQNLQRPAQQQGLHRDSGSKSGEQPARDLSQQSANFDLQSQKSDIHNKIPIRICRVESIIPGIHQIIINRKICLNAKELPRTVLVDASQYCQIKISTEEGLVLETVFMARPQLKKTLLFHKSKEVGCIYFGDQETEESICVTLNKRVQERQEPAARNMPMINTQLDTVTELEPPSNKIETQMIRAEIISVIPKAAYNVLIDQNVSITYPSENTLLIRNKIQDEFTITVNSEKGTGQSRVRILEGTNRYVINQKDSTILCIIEIRAQPYQKEAEEKPESNYSRKLYLLLSQENLSYLDKKGQDLTAQYNYVVEAGDRFFKIQISSSAPETKRKVVTIMQAIEIPESESYAIQVFDKDRSVQREYRFRLRLHSMPGIFRHQGLLCSGAARLSLILFESNTERNQYEAQWSKLITKMFTNPESLHLMYEKLRRSQNNWVTLSNILRADFGLTISQVDIFKGLVGNIKDYSGFFNPCMTSLSLKNNSRLSQDLTIAGIAAEFSLYDFKKNGHVKMERAQKILNLLFKEETESLLAPHEDWEFEKIADYFEHNQRLFDYYEFISRLEASLSSTEPAPSQQNNNRKPTQSNNGTVQIPKNTADTQPENVKKWSGNRKVTLLKYQNLAYRGQAGTYVFFISQKKFTDPVPRCFSHQFADPKPYLIVNLPAELVVLNKEYGGKQLVSFSQIARASIQEKVNVLGGQVYLTIEPAEAELPRNRSKNETNMGSLGSVDNLIRNEYNQKMQEEAVRPSYKMQEKEIDPRQLNSRRKEYQQQLDLVTPIKTNIPAQNTLYQMTKKSDLQQDYNSIKRVLRQDVDLSKYNFQSDSEEDD